MTMTLQLVIKIYVFVGLVWPFRCETFQQERLREQQILRGLLQRDNYDAHIRPSPLDQDDGPTQVKLQIYIRNIDHLDDMKQEYGMQVTFRQTWSDRRLSYSVNASDIRFIHIRDPTLVWKPDVFFANKVEGRLHTVPEPNLLMRLYPNGTIMYSSRITLRLTCHFDLRRYPHDKQMCPVVLPSYGYMADEIELNWKEPFPVTIAKYLRLPMFMLEKFQTKRCDSRTTTGIYSCVSIELYFERQLTSYVRGIYIPTTMLVLLAWLTFWLHPATALTSRTVIAMVALLAMTLLCTDVHRSSPPTGYNKPIDTWMGVCMTFIFASIAELVLVQWLCNKERRCARSGKTTDTDSNKELLDATIGPENFSMQPLGDTGMDRTAGVTVRPLAGRLQFWWRWWGALMSYSPPERVDVVHRIGFLIVFALFQLCYWATYLP